MGTQTVKNTGKNIAPGEKKVLFHSRNIMKYIFGDPDRVCHLRKLYGVVALLGNVEFLNGNVNFLITFQSNK